MIKKLIKLPLAVLLRFSKLFSREKLYKLMVSAIKEFCTKDQKIISIGAGGAIKKVLMNEQLDFTEIDIDEKRKPDFVCDIENMSMIENNSIDVYFCMEVLEHVRNPFNGVSEIYRTLKPGGIIIGSTPFVFPIHDEPFDFYRYTKYGLENLFNEFEKIKLVERNSYVKSIYVILLRLLNIGNKKQRLVGILLFPVYLVLLPFILLASIVVTNKQSTTGYFFIFRKRS